MFNHLKMEMRNRRWWHRRDEWRTWATIPSQQTNTKTTFLIREYLFCAIINSTVIGNRYSQKNTRIGAFFGYVEKALPKWK